MKKLIDDHGKVLSDSVGEEKGSDVQGYPIQYVREFVHIEDGVNGLAKAEQKALSKPNAMAYKRQQQAIKKEFKNEEYAPHV